jgi:hypothetical protein
VVGMSIAVFKRGFKSMFGPVVPLSALLWGLCWAD